MADGMEIAEVPGGGNCGSHGSYRATGYATRTAGGLCFGVEIHLISVGMRHDEAALRVCLTAFGGVLHNGRRVDQSRRGLKALGSRRNGRVRSTCALHFRVKACNNSRRTGGTRALHES